jgi:hypothetical protein
VEKYCICFVKSCFIILGRLTKHCSAFLCKNPAFFFNLRFRFSGSEILTIHLFKKPTYEREDINDCCCHCLDDNNRMQKT